jgi:putative membrane protein
MNRKSNPNILLAKKLERWAIIFSIVVLVLVIAMRYFTISMPFDVMLLPPFHAVINSLTEIALLFSFGYIKSGNIDMHRNFNILALVLSAIFLLSYVLYHISTEPTSYGGEGVQKTIYYLLLITHVVLAAVSLPFILFTFIRAYTRQFDRHKRMARWVYPIWLYVAITGPICYFMLAPYY